MSCALYPRVSVCSVVLVFLLSLVRLDRSHKKARRESVSLVCRAVQLKARLAIASTELGNTKQDFS